MRRSLRNHRMMRYWPTHALPSKHLTSLTTMTGHVFSICFTAHACGIPTNTYGWGMSVSAVNWNSSMPCYAAGRKRRFRISPEIYPSSNRSSMSSPWIPTRNFPAMRHTRLSVTSLTHSIGRSTMLNKGASLQAMQSCNHVLRSA